MYLLYCDETNIEPEGDRFFVYGGLVVPKDAAIPLTEAIDNIRQEYGIGPNETLKFNPRPKPKRISHDDFKEIKKSVIEAATKNGCGFIASVLLQHIATSPDEGRRNEINRVAYHFNCLLNRWNECGLVLIDRFSDTQIDEHLREKFLVGLKDMPYAKKIRLKNIVGFHYSLLSAHREKSFFDLFQPVL